MSLALSSQAVALVTSDHSGEASVQKGRVAYEKGDYGAALQIFTPLAEKRDLLAQFNIGKDVSWRKRCFQRLQGCCKMV